MVKKLFDRKTQQAAQAFGNRKARKGAEAMMRKALEKKSK